MQMQEGIGRGGYRLLAIVFAGVGVLGVVTTLVAFNASSELESFFRWLGFALTTSALLALVTLVLVILAPARAARIGKPTPVSEPLPEPTADPAGVPEATGALSDPGVEFTDVEPAPAPEPAVRGPPPRVQPPPPVFVHPPSRPRDAKGWPERKGPTGMTRRQAAEAAAAPEPAEDKRHAAARDAPLVMARTAASAESAGLPDNVGVGKCSNCNVLLLAPKKRPIRLQCPRCERVHVLA